MVCATHPDFPEMETREGVTVHRVGHANLLDALRSNSSFQHSRDEIRSGTPGKSSNEGVLIKTARWVMKNIYWPDGSFIWIRPAQKKALGLLNKFHFEGIVSVSLPFSSHVVGLNCKLRYPMLKWIMDVGDPFSPFDIFQLNNHFFYKKKNFRVERKAVRLAASVVHSNKGALRLYNKYFPESSSKMVVIPPLYEEPGALEHDVTPFEKGRIHIGYFGSFYFNIRPPDALLKLFSQLIIEMPKLKNKISLHLFGNIEPPFFKKIRQYDELNNIIVLHGTVHKTEAGWRMQECDFLVNLGNKTDSQLPSKSVDYMMSGKPILNVCHRADDTFASFFYEYPFIHNILFENQEFSKNELEAVISFFADMKGKKVGRKWLEENKKTFDVEAITAEYERLIIN